jgi:citrate synthase
MSDIKKGLAGVVVDTTSVSKVNPETNSLLYSGYPVDELAEKCSFEEVAFLLWYGELPTDTQLRAFERFERANRGLDEHVKRVIDELPLTAHPMDVVRTAVSAFGRAIPRLPTRAGTRTSTRRSACSRSCRPSSPTCSGRRAARSSCRRATTSATARTSCT